LANVLECRVPSSVTGQLVVPNGSLNLSSLNVDLNVGLLVERRPAVAVETHTLRSAAAPTATSKLKRFIGPPGIGCKDKAALHGCSAALRKLIYSATRLR